MLKGFSNEWRQKELRQGNPEEGVANLQRPEALHRRQILRNNQGRREHNKSEHREKRCQNRQIPRRYESKIDQWSTMDQFMNDKSDDEQSASEQQAADQPELSQSSRLP